MTTDGEQLGFGEKLSGSVLGKESRVSGVKRGEWGLR